MFLVWGKLGCNRKRLFGKLQNKVSMEIGQHFMEGKVVELDEPFLVLRNEDGKLSTCGFVEKKCKTLLRLPVVCAALDH